MKKILLSMISFGMAFAICACSDDSSSSTEPEKESGKSGDFGKFGAIDDDVEEILAEAIKGTDYESAECDSVSIQVVAGTNYKFQCSVKDGKKTKDVVLTVFEPLPSSDASVQLTLVTDADGEVLFENPVEFKDEGDDPMDDCDGCFGKFSAVDKDAKKILEEAVKGTDYEDAECDSVSIQVVAGTNYKFQCSIKDGKKTKDVVLTVFEPLPSSDASVQLTLVEDSDGKTLFEAKVETEDEGDEKSDDGEEAKKDDKSKDEELSFDVPDLDIDKPTVDLEEGGMSGGFSKVSAIDEDDKKVLAEAVKGTDYEDAECDSVSTQVVAGTNYKFQCSIKDGKKTKNVVLKVFEPLPNSDKPVQLTLVTDADGEVLFESEVEFEAEDEESDDDGKKSDEGCDGCFGDYEELTEDDMDVFEKANKLSDSTFVNPTKVSKQVVAGMNYKFMCELEVSEGETKDVFLEVYKNVKDEIEITSVTERVKIEVLDVGADPSISKDCGSSIDGLVTNCDVKLGEKN